MLISKEDGKVKEYFEKKAKDFDEIYDDKGGIIKKIANRIFRTGMKERFDLTLKLCGSGNRSVLDIGCGAGRFCIPLAERGMNVTGIDYSAEMIKMANEYLMEYNTQNGKNIRIKYLCCDFLKNFNPKINYDISLAIGVFDYLKNPLPFLKKMKNITKKIIIASFPAKFTPQMPIRKIWLLKRKCPVYFYTKKQINELYNFSGINNYKIINISAGYLVKAKVN